LLKCSVCGAGIPYKESAKTIVCRCGATYERPKYQVTVTPSVTPRLSPPRVRDDYVEWTITLLVYPTVVIDYVRCNGIYMPAPVEKYAGELVTIDFVLKETVGAPGTGYYSLIDIDTGLPITDRPDSPDPSDQEFPVTAYGSYMFAIYADMPAKDWRLRLDSGHVE